MVDTAKTVEQALRLLRALASGGPGSTSELARRVGLNRTVTHRLLTTLQLHGFTRRHDDRFELGVALLELGQKVAPELRQVTRPLLTHLGLAAGETAVLTVPDGDEAVALDQVAAAGHVVRVEYPPGFRHPLALGAHGLAILAFCQPARIDRALAAAPDPDAARQHLLQTRERGYATSHDQLNAGAWGLAAPVFADHGEPLGSIGVVAPLNRPPDEPRLAQATLAAAASASARLGGAARAARTPALGDPVAAGSS